MTTGESPEDVAARAPLPDDETAERLRRLLFGGRRRTTRVDADGDNRAIAAGS